MPASKDETRPVRVDDRKGVQLDTVQRLERNRVPTHGGGGPPGPPRDGDDDGDRRVAKPAAFEPQSEQPEGGKAEAVRRGEIRLIALSPGDQPDGIAPQVIN